MKGYQTIKGYHANIDSALRPIFITAILIYCHAMTEDLQRNDDLESNATPLHAMPGCA
jgi:hypothetical protein